MTKKTGRARFKQDPETLDTIMSTPFYHKQFVEAFKDVVPYSARRVEDGRGWKEEDSVWVFDTDYKDQVSDLALQYFAKDTRVSRLKKIRRHPKL